MFRFRAMERVKKLVCNVFQIFLKAEYLLTSSDGSPNFRRHPERDIWKEYNHTGKRQTRILQKYTSLRQNYSRVE